MAGEAFASPCLNPSHGCSCQCECGSMTIHVWCLGRDYCISPDGGMRLHTHTHTLLESIRAMTATAQHSGTVDITQLSWSSPDEIAVCGVLLLFVARRTVAHGEADMMQSSLFRCRQLQLQLRGRLVISPQRDVQRGSAAGNCYEYGRLSISISPPSSSCYNYSYSCFYQSALAARDSR